MNDEILTNTLESSINVSTNTIVLSILNNIKNEYTNKFNEVDQVIQRQVNAIINKRTKQDLLTNAKKPFYKTLENMTQDNEKLNSLISFKNKIIQNNYTNASEAVKIIDDCIELIHKVAESRNNVVKNFNNKILSNKLSDLVLRTLPQDNDILRQKIKTDLNLPDTEVNGEPVENEEVTKYMSVVDFEKNKDALQQNYKPTNSGGRKRKTKKNKKSYRKKNKKSYRKKNKKSYRKAF